jgi:hypothetical protein
MTKQTWVQIALAINGLAELFAGAALLLAPTWFYQTIGTFPPFNQHYLGDAGAFLLPLGLGLLLALSDPRRHRLLIGMVALAGLLHTGNHLYDDLILGHWTRAHLASTGVLIFETGLLVWAWWAVRE